MSSLVSEKIRIKCCRSCSKKSGRLKAKAWRPVAPICFFALRLVSIPVQKAALALERAEFSQVLAEF